MVTAVCWTSSPNFYLGMNLAVDASPISSRSSTPHLRHQNQNDHQSTSKAPYEACLVAEADLPARKRADEAPILKLASDVQGPEEPVYALVRRLLPLAYHDHFEFVLNSRLTPPASATNIYDSFRISNGNSTANGITGAVGKVLIEGASISGLGAGLNYYLREICQVEMTWSGDRFDDLPAVPPPMSTTTGTNETVIRASFVPWRYYMNVVTFGYSFGFWDWKRWEREIDWMLLNGVNMALAMVGQEYVFRQMYEDMGLTREELNEFFGGPAYMPWQRMGNLQGSWEFDNDGPLKDAWIDSQWELQGQIMTKFHEFNISTILPSFNGFVPRQLVSKYPDVKFERASVWADMPKEYTRVRFVPSTEPFFANLTRRFIQLQSSMYQQKGLNVSTHDKNHYLLDLYNELHPTCMEVECLQNITKGVMKALKSADPKAVWTMQSWFLLNKDIWKTEEIRAFFDGIREINEGRDAFVIDLYSDVAPLWDKTQGFFGIDWGWSMLNNFGGGQALYGTLPTLLTEPFRGYQQNAKKMRGMGITMEGINNNEYLYQLVLDIPWESVETTAGSLHPSSPRLTGQELNQPALDGQRHLEDFIKRRYGPNQTSPPMLQAWTTLSQTVWNDQSGQMSQSKAYLDVTPSLDMDHLGFLATVFHYNQTKVVEAWSQLVQSTETEGSKQRRGSGYIQEAIKEVLKATNGKPDIPTLNSRPKTYSGDGRDEGIAFKPTFSKFEPPATFASRFWKAIQDSISRLLGLSPDKQQQQLKTEPIHTSEPNPIRVLANAGTIAISMDSIGTSSSGTSESPVQDIILTTINRLAAAALPKESDLPLNVSSFRYDLVDVTREVMVAVVIPGLHKELVEAFKQKDLNTTKIWGQLLLGAILDTDRILATHPHFMLGPWIRDARISAKVVTAHHWASNDTVEMARYADYLEHNARSQITWWAPYGQVNLSDYASKEWAGLVKEFYYPRWEIFVDHLVKSLMNRKPFNNKQYLSDSLKKETEWQKETTCLGSGCPAGTNRETDKKYPMEPVESTTEVAQALWDQWKTVAARLAEKAERSKS
ncbi:hypothetical protein EDD11_003002 [Mortierella claussenii]|nr:hypothetical protein EDD11_003002 [Mortierella claussenii]